MCCELKHHYKKINKNNYSSFLLAGDIGGTNANFGVIGIKNNLLSLLFSFHYKSRKIKSIVLVINEILDYCNEKYAIKINKLCIAVAGPVSENRGYCKLTNLNWAINIKNILKKTKLKSIILLNDFEAIGYSVNVLDNSDLFIIKKNKNQKKLTKAVIGAGTGLGKSILIYDKHLNCYTPIPSEGGHSDFPCMNKEEIELINFIKKFRKINKVDYEEILSGRGIEAIYYFLKQRKKIKSVFKKEIQESDVRSALISQLRNKDRLCKEVFKIYSKFYGRCCRNFALETLAKGGLYIAGGIAAKNKDIFKTKEFLNEFYNTKYKKIIQDIPIFVVTNTNAGLLGAGFAGIKRRG